MTNPNTSRIIANRTASLSLVDLLSPARWTTRVGLILTLGSTACSAPSSDLARADGASSNPDISLDISIDRASNRDSLVDDSPATEGIKLEETSIADGGDAVEETSNDSGIMTDIPSDNLTLGDKATGMDMEPSSDTANDVMQDSSRLDDGSSDVAMDGGTDDATMDGSRDDAPETAFIVDALDSERNPSDIGSTSDVPERDIPDVSHVDSGRDISIPPRTEPCYFSEVITFPNGYMAGPSGATITNIVEPTTPSNRVRVTGTVDRTDHCAIVRGTAVDRRDGGLSLRNLSAEFRVGGRVIGPATYVDRGTFGSASTLLPTESPGVLCFRSTLVISGPFEGGSSFPPDAAVVPIRYQLTSGLGNCEVIYGTITTVR